MENQEEIANDNWLNEEHIICPSCGQSLFRIDTSPFDDSYHFYCDSCPVRMEVSFYDPQLDQFEQTLPAPHESEERTSLLLKMMEDHLKPCTCGGTFRHDAPRRCFSCSAPVIIEDPAYVDLYLNEDGFAQETEANERFEIWRSRFCPDVEDKWKNTIEPEIEKAKAPTSSAEIRFEGQR